jgi:type VI secretion system secreted protein Hcp
MAIGSGFGRGVGGTAPGKGLGDVLGGLAHAIGADVDFFLKIDGILGESLDAKHKGAIDVLSWTFGAAQAASLTSGGLGAGQAVHGPFHFVAHFNKASPKLFLACLNGEHLKSGVLTCRKAGGTQEVYLQINFTDFMISEYVAVGGAGTTLPSDQVSLVYTKIEVIYKPQDSTGALLAGIRMGQDVKLKKPF